MAGEEIKEVRRMAQDAINRVNQHEVICAERYNMIINRLDTLYGRMTQATWGLIAVLLGIISYLLTKYVV